MIPLESESALEAPRGGPNRPLHGRFMLVVNGITEVGAEEPASFVHSFRYGISRVRGGYQRSSWTSSSSARRLPGLFGAVSLDGSSG